MKNQDDQIEDNSVEVAAILHKLRDTRLHHVTDVELPSAIIRAIQMFRVHSGTELKTLIDLIDNNDEQIEVHAEPGDPQN